MIQLEFNFNNEQQLEFNFNKKEEQT